ncbi:MAG: alanine racemase [Verrucomicrobiae bacterium]|jgi:alanine racemase|nr:alanine racemase [Verrucomicrobiae bacterium]
MQQGIPNDKNQRPVLKKQVYRTWVEIDRRAFRHNLRVIKQHAPDATIIAVVKADAYGHGIQEVVTAISKQVNYFAVASLEEALIIEAIDHTHPIMLLSAALPSEYSAIAEHGFIPTISSYEEARRFAKVAPVGALIHFKINTGMGRLGAFYETAEKTLKKICRLPLTIQSISTHLPSADSDLGYTRQQIRLFRKTMIPLLALAPHAEIHFLNSAGLLRFPQEAHETVRLGLLLYGVAPLPRFQKLLRPAMTWKATICFIHKLPKGSSVSYGRTYCAPRDIRVAILPVGYGDGYPRQVSGNGAFVLIQGKRAPILGRVTMDQIVVDVTSIANVKVGDEAVLIGKQGKHEITATELAAKANTISWHLFTGITNRVHRCYHG